MDLDERLRAASPTERNKAIVEAYQAGYTIRRIADLVGLSVGGVHKIIKENTP
jgi:DNA-directed RNA polymerase specialized sigma24 family protein